MRALLLILTIFVVFSGCVEEKNIAQTNESISHVPVNITPENLSSTPLSLDAENLPEIEVKSFSSICTCSQNDRAVSEKIDGYLFCWDNVPGNESQRLKNYLRHDLNISWADNAQIVKTNNCKTISIFTAENSLDLTVGNNETSVLAAVNSVPLCYLQLKKESGKICVYRLEEYKQGYNVTEKFYAIYGLSIKNNGSKIFDFRLNGLNVRDGSNIFNSTNAPESQFSYRNEILSDFEKEPKIEDATLFPGQIINGSVIFQVSSLYKESFRLTYNGAPISSASFEKSINVMSTADSYNYFEVFGLPPYSYEGPGVSFEPSIEAYPSVFPNWVNRSVFEFFNKADSVDRLKYPPTKIPPTDIIYALKAIPGKNITMLPISRFSPDTLCIDETGEELINTSIKSKVIILNSQKNFSNATIVKISYQNAYGWPLMGRISFIDQDLVLDNKQNLVAAKYYCRNFIS